MTTEHEELIRTLPGDDLRQIMWRFAERFDLQMLVQSTRSVARSLVARLVLEGQRNTHEWTDEKAELLEALDAAGVTAAFFPQDLGGFIEGPKNLAFALSAFELSWVDAGAATCSMAGNLALAPINERGTEEQRAHYMKLASPPQPGEDRKPWRGAFALTEPLPYVGVDTGVLSGKVRIADWSEGEEPQLLVEKRGRFITGMDFANFVTAAVETDDERIKSSCMIILEEGDEGLYDRGAPTKKMVHQLSSTRDPIFRLTVPASRIIGGYQVKDGRIVPTFNHSQVIDAVFKRTRVTVGLMTAAKVLSSVEPIIRYQRGRFRGGSYGEPGSPRHDLGIQMKEDAVHRLVDVWATGEAAASLGFAAARVFDEYDPLEQHKSKQFAEQGIKGRKQLVALKKVEKQAAVLQDEEPLEPEERMAILEDPMVRFVLADALANVLCPACKLWNTSIGATMLREAVSLMGGYGITEDCPGFLGSKWIDTQLEATYEGPESVQRRQLSVTMTNDLFLGMLGEWYEELVELAVEQPSLGTMPLAAAIEIWLWTLGFLQDTAHPSGNKLYHSKRQSVTFPLADALCWILAARYFTDDVKHLLEKGADHPVVGEGFEGTENTYSDLVTVQSARSAAEVGRICAELVYGYQEPLPMECCCGEEDGEEDECCHGHGHDHDDECCGAHDHDDSSDDGEEEDDVLFSFMQMRVELDNTLRGVRLAKERAARAVTKVMIPEAQDYPV